MQYPKKENKTMITRLQARATLSLAILIYHLRTMGFIPLWEWTPLPALPRLNASRFPYTHYLRARQRLAERAAEHYQLSLIPCSGCGRVWMGLRSIYGETFCDEKCESVFLKLYQLQLYLAGDTDSDSALELLYPEVQYGRSASPDGTLQENGSARMLTSQSRPLNILDSALQALLERLSHKIPKLHEPYPATASAEVFPVRETWP